MSSERSTQNRGISRRAVLRRGAVATAIAGLGLSGLTGSAAAGGTGGDGVPSDAIPIDGPTVITEPGYYVLTKNIVGQPPESDSVDPRRDSIINIELGVDDVTIDGQGYSLIGRGETRYGISAGVYPDAPTNDNITIKNLVITGFSFAGIELEEVFDSRIQNVKITHCRHALEYLTAVRVTVSDCIIAKNDLMLFDDEGASGSVFLRNRITRNGGVANIDFASDSVLKDNRVDYNGGGWGLINSSGAKIVGNLFYQNAAGFSISEYVGVGSNTVIRGNRFIENERYGLFVDGSASAGISIDGSVIEENDVLRNGGDGIRFRSAFGPSTLSKNRIIGNGADGIKFLGSDEHEIVGNLIRQNGGDGIELTRTEFTTDPEGSDNNVIRENIIRENGDLPIRIGDLSTGNVVEDNLIGDDAPNTCRIDDY
ncbi:right-handed parallel beta-helix repeat-containing protein [Haloferax sp. DFSO52]|uniref:right-handed parallel beta-helix repeat-containing protein n=1 Tax=Haloferax sp. DFSO52 TaxID=3388505 RepID=UPI003A8569DB